MLMIRLCVVDIIFFVCVSLQGRFAVLRKGLPASVWCEMRSLRTVYSWQSFAGLFET